MTADPFPRQFPATTLAEVRAELTERTKDKKFVDTSLADISFHLNEGDPGIELGQSRNGDKIVVPSSDTNVGMWADHFNIPAPYFKRVGDVFGLSTQGDMLRDWQQVGGGEPIRVEYNDKGVILGVHKPGRVVVDPIDLVDIAIETLGSEESEVTRLVDMPSEFAFDVHVPASVDLLTGYGIGGDPKVGDVTAGGLGYKLNRKLNHAPTIESYLYRLTCTNGMRTVDENLKVDARGRDLDQLLANIAQVSHTAFGRVERMIQHFYNMREEQVENPERLLRRYAHDYKIAPRVLDGLEDLAASDYLPDEPSQFDIINLITNYANSDKVRNDGGRLTLESVGGSVIVAAEPRCHHCKNRTDH